MSFRHSLLLTCFFALSANLALADTGENSISTLKQAEAIIKQDINTEINDPTLNILIEKEKSHKNSAIADRQLPDPKINFSFRNFPTNSFSYTKENMTQIVTGLSQKIPRGKTLHYKKEQSLAQASIEHAKYINTQNIIKLSLRESWFELYYWKQALININKSQKLLKKVIKASESAYENGRRNSQDIIRAELELEIQTNKAIDIKRHIKTAKSNVLQWIDTTKTKNSERHNISISHNFSKLPQLKNHDEIQKNLPHHSQVLIADAKINKMNYGVNIAEQLYKPEFNLALNYGKRNGTFPSGEDRSDFLSAMVTLDVPLFTKNRQDKKLAAKKHDLNAALFTKDDILQKLNTKLDVEHANWTYLNKRIWHYETKIIKSTKDNFDASMRAYQEDRADFSSLIRAQVMVLDSKLQLIKLKTDRAKSHSRLLYLQGGSSHE